MNKSNILCLMEVGLILFILSTLTFYLMYYFYQPKRTRSDLDPRDRNSHQSELKLGGKVDHIKDIFTSIECVSEAIVRAGVRKARLVLGIDLTASNEWQGRLSFNGNCLHKLHPVRPSSVYNPYQRVIKFRQ